MTTIDEYSISAVPIQQRVNNLGIGAGTGSCFMLMTEPRSEQIAELWAKVGDGIRDKAAYPGGA